MRNTCLIDLEVGHDLESGNDLLMEEWLILENLTKLTIDTEQRIVLYKALEEAGYRFDASGVSSGPALPGEDAGVARFSLPQIAEGPSSRRVIAMDYNLFVRHSGGFERPDEAAAFQERSYEAFKAAIDPLL
mgnify:CR=1 FL=1